MELAHLLGTGFAAVLTPTNLMFCFIGALLGTLIGVLPGIGPVPTMAILLPITYGLSPLAALIMLAGIFYGAQYGGSTTAILMNLPGETSSVITCLDGHAMARKGDGGKALAIAAIGSFIAGSIATLVIALIGPLLGRLAVQFTPADYFSLMVLGLSFAVVLAHGSVLRAVAMVLLGCLLGLVGTDINSGLSRMTFGIPELADGINFVPLAVGLFGISEILFALEGNADARTQVGKIASIWPNRQDIKASLPAILRGTLLGSSLGILPGGGATLSSFAAYAVEKKLSAHPEQFGTGVIQGVAAPESANNAGAQTSFIPLLTLGIPTNAIMALMVGAMTIQGIVPGPQVMVRQPELFWGLIASMWIGNAMLLALNLPLIGLWVRLLQVPYRILYPAIMIFACIGVYSINGSVFDVLTMAIFSILGFALKKLQCEPAPLLLGFVLGVLMEDNFRRSLMLSRGDPSVYLREPMSLVLLTCAMLMLIATFLPSMRRGREETFKEPD